MPQDKLFPVQFMHQSKEIRDYLCQMWKIPRTGISEVRDNTVISDGHTLDDLAVITLERMCEYIGSEESFGRAWEITCAKAHSELHPPVGTITGNPKEIKTVEELPVETPKNAKETKGK